MKVFSKFSKTYNFKIIQLLICRLNLAGSQGPAGSFNFKSGQLPRQSLPGGGGTSSAGNGVNNRVPLTDDGRVDLQRLSLPQGNLFGCFAFYVVNLFSGFP